MSTTPTPAEALRELADHELMIAAGLSMEGSHDWRYVAFANYSRELKVRRITWAAAKKLKEKFKAITNYPKRGWEGRYTRALSTLTQPPKEQRK
jgi:hypothetical protein